MNTAEGLWSRLKLGIRGTPVHVGAKHLPKYLAEFQYRFNLRHRPEMMFAKLLLSFQAPAVRPGTVHPVGVQNDHPPTATGAPCANSKDPTMGLAPNTVINIRISENSGTRRRDPTRP